MPSVFTEQYQTTYTAITFLERILLCDAPIAHLKETEFVHIAVGDSRFYNFYLLNSWQAVSIIVSIPRAESVVVMSTFMSGSMPNSVDCLSLS